MVKLIFLIFSAQITLLGLSSFRNIPPVLQPPGEVREIIVESEAQVGGWSPGLSAVLHGIFFLHLNISIPLAWINSILSAKLMV